MLEISRLTVNSSDKDSNDEMCSRPYTDVKYSCTHLWLCTCGKHSVGLSDGDDDDIPS